MTTPKKKPPQNRVAKKPAKKKAPVRDAGTLSPVDARERQRHYLTKKARAAKVAKARTKTNARLRDKGEVREAARVKAKRRTRARVAKTARRGTAREYNY